MGNLAQEIRGRIAGALLVVIFGALSGSNALGSTISIMPLGDSITYGYSDPAIVPGGFRAVMYRDLVAAGYSNIQLVGSLTTNPDPTLPAAANSHEGHYGYLIAGTGGYQSFSINGPNINNWLAPGNGVNPNLILLQIGTNEILGDYHVASAPQELAALVTRITELRPNAEILISTITPQANPAREAQVETFNQAISGPNGIVAQLQQLGEKVALVNAGGSLTEDDISPDGVHPSQEGYVKLGNAWAVGVEEALSKVGLAPEPSTFALYGAGFLALISVARANRKASKRV